jgi:hypothetical protein
MSHPLLCNKALSTPLKKYYPMKTQTLLITTLLCFFTASFIGCSKKTDVTQANAPVTPPVVTPPVTTPPVIPPPVAYTGSLIVQSFTGPVTQSEINAFKSYMVDKVPAPATSNGNEWVFGDPGKDLEACDLMYEASKDIDILNRMIYYADACLSQRNDLESAANGGQLTIWNGAIAPVWPSTGPGVTPITADVEQGEDLSHMIYCSLLILQNPSVWNTTVPAGDPYGYGTTYKARALTYLTQGDYVIDKWILPYFIKTSESNHYYFAAAPNTYNPGVAAFWNQAWMLTEGLARLSQCHAILNDNPTRLAQYDAIVKPNIAWFLTSLKSNRSAAGTACYIWPYGGFSGVEDTNHFAYDTEGLWIAYYSGRYGLTPADLIPFANTYVDVVLGTVQNGLYAGLVNGTYGTGHSAGDNYVRDEYLYHSEFRPDKYLMMCKIDSSKIHSSPPIAARILWEKNRRYLNITAVHP